MDVDSKGSDWQPCQPDTLVQGLRCPVCLDYFERPHTLGCGHTFCLRCLRTLARVTRHSRVRAPLDRLRFRCPSCRKLTLARPILSRRASVNYALKELVDEWFSSPYSSGSIDCLTLRSIGSQTETEDISSGVGGVGKKSKLNLKVADDTAADYETSDDDDVATEEFRDVLFHKMAPKPLASDENEIKLINPALITDESGLSADEIQVTSSSEEEESEQEIVPFLGELQVINNNNEEQLERLRFNRFQATTLVGVVSILFREWLIVWRGIRRSRSRAILTMFWMIYGGFVVCVSRGFLPWMAFYTVIYFLILYAEMSQPAMWRH